MVSDGLIYIASPIEKMFDHPERLLYYRKREKFIRWFTGQFGYLVPYCPHKAFVINETERWRPEWDQINDAAIDRANAFIELRVEGVESVGVQHDLARWRDLRFAVSDRPKPVVIDIMRFDPVIAVIQLDAIYELTWMLKPLPVLPTRPPDVEGGPDWNGATRHIPAAKISELGLLMSDGRMVPFPVPQGGDATIIDYQSSIPGDDRGWLPKRKYDDDCGQDLVTVDESLVAPGEQRILACGVRMNLPPGMFGMVTNRSSTSARGLLVLPGIIDAGYTGEVFVTIHNIGKTAQRINSGDRVAQLILLRHVDADYRRMPLGAVFPDTARGPAGFGSTGV